VLAVVICAIALSLAYPVREYIAQRGQIGQLVAEQQERLAQVRNLQAQDARLTDPSYVEHVAQQQLDMCFPGTRCYIVVAGGGSPAGATPPQRPAAAPWYAKLWRSVQQADANPSGPGPAK
jgi:cell division protein FtsL